ncbi:hypothetical protein J4225_00120 [Candidatus Pacearchaeota archaeon]|nr:hypothetical protein [Candidatus Pacearchaeota archaeon]
MRNLKKFEEFTKEGFVKKQTPDSERAKSLIGEAEDKLKFYEKLKDKLGFEELNPNYIVETCYDILIEILRAKILLLGYKTDSHEAEVSFMRNLGFSESDVLFMNQLRYFINGIKYYGKIFDKDYSEKVDKFLYRCLEKLK